MVQNQWKHLWKVLSAGIPFRWEHTSESYYQFVERVEGFKKIAKHVTSKRTLPFKKKQIDIDTDLFSMIRNAMLITMYYFIVGFY